MSQRIRVRGESSTPPFANGNGIAISFTDSFYYLARVAWSNLPDQSRDGSFGLKVLLLHNEDDFHNWLFVLKQSEQEGEDTWERIGFGALPNFPGPPSVQDFQLSEWLDLDFRNMASVSATADCLRDSLASSYFKGQGWVKEYLVDDDVNFV